ncbi:hypothetical protein [Clostridium magnum]|uniref:Uncharacterized protein n=1 Tax=Clostridium magnum DSM 2767 TaxID=1121326 RepID=A0A162T572_9CLOT|nr:hypothetical protein [Clostridium magnum]KZL92259.1 hypothetical protein CLMAG_20680 [Clostridium magnum DSM 2767]SHH15898.1 hypothetical protein SAMN02745944_00159 [Clostridium magnum DSM 2767]
MENYRGYEITVIENNEKEYPFKAIARKGDKEVKHKGQSKTQAIDYVKKSINVIIEKIEAKNEVKLESDRG